MVLNIFYALNGNINGGFVARSQISNVPFFREKHLRLTKTLEQNWLLKCGYVVCPFSTLYFVLFLVEFMQYINSVNILFSDHIKPANFVKKSSNFGNKLQFWQHWQKSQRQFSFYSIFSRKKQRNV